MTTLVCPRCGGSEIKEIEPTHLNGGNWNPIWSLFQILFGLRIMNDHFVCRSCKRRCSNEIFHSFVTIVGAMHDNRIWDGATEIMNWEGFYCPSCQEEMACEFTALDKSDNMDFKACVVASIIDFEITSEMD